MPIDSGNLALKGLDDLFSTEENRQEEQREQVQQIPIDALHPFTNHPFKVLDDEAMTRTVESIAQYGVLAPLIARPRPDGDGYEIISGHRRQYAAKLAGLETLPVIVRQMSDDAAVILMVDSNLQREHILPSERALAYKMKLDAMRRTSGRPSKENPRQLVGNFETADVVGKESGESGRQVQRFIRLTNLIPELLDMVDEKKISFNPAVELSYLDESQQRDFLEAMEDTQNAPSLSQAQQLKKMAQQGEFSYEKAFDVMGQEKKSEKDTVTIKNETLRKYFPRSYTPKQMEEKIIQLLVVILLLKILGKSPSYHFSNSINLAQFFYFCFAHGIQIIGIVSTYHLRIGKSNIGYSQTVNQFGQCYISRLFNTVHQILIGLLPESFHLNNLGLMVR